MISRYSAEQLSFLKIGYLTMPVPELTIAFNEKYGLDKSEKAIKSALTSRGYTCGRKCGIAKGDYKLFTAEQVEFIRVEYLQLTLAELTPVINKKFGLSVSKSQLKTFVHNHGINCGRNGCFKKGHKSWSAGTKGLIKPNSGSFKKGHEPSNLNPVGHERLCSTDGYILIKTDQVNPHTGAQGWYRPKHVVMWEHENGPVPKGMNLRFKDGDKLHIETDNLELVSKALHLRLNSNKLNGAPDEIKPTIRAISELEVKTFDRLRG